MMSACGCNVGGVLGEPTSSEKKIPAEYDISKHKDSRVLILIDEARSSGATYKDSLELAETLEAYLIDKTKLKGEQIILQDDSKLSNITEYEFSKMPVADVANTANADIVIYVGLLRFEMYQAGMKDYYSGSMAARAMIFDSAGQRLWPVSMDGKPVHVAVELETKGRALAMARMTTAAAHCIVRYLHNCPKDQFDIREEQKEYEMYSW